LIVGVDRRAFSWRSIKQLARRILVLIRHDFLAFGGVLDRYATEYLVQDLTERIPAR
jgi:hypothetical protein